MGKYENKKKHILLKIIGRFILIFITATLSIVLYDMYINIEVEEESYNADKITREVSVRK